MPATNAPTAADRTAVLKRLPTRLVCMIFFEATALLIQLSVIFQNGCRSAAKRRSEPLRPFACTLAHCGRQLMRCNTPNDNRRPFPFNPFPDDGETEPLAKQVQSR